MIVLDAYVVIAALRDEPAAAEVGAVLRGDVPAVLTPLGVAEVVDRLVRVAAVEPDDAVLDVAELGLADPDPLEPDVALRAGLLRAQHYHRTRCAVSMADCVAAETARQHDAPVATSDPHLLNMCNAEGIAVVALPDSQGERWTPS